ncbi:SPFH domain-containing protein [Marinicellulosiphila megalodicopiae]|uniref:SPFH domain-containing protein n=1 Tax=Marinicellulosiphila megalodicopiae TaxID=2724896 RepID=UPI003BAE3096
MGFILSVFAIIAACIFGIWFLYASFYKKVDSGTAMVINLTGTQSDVEFTGRIVLPIIHHKEVMDISLKTIEIDRRGKDGLICLDNIRADIKVAFFVRVNNTKQDVLKVAKTIGCTRTFEQETIENLFCVRFSEALKTASHRLNFIELFQTPDKFRNDIYQTIGSNLNGYVLEDIAIDYLVKTPIENLKKVNILEVQDVGKSPV